METSGAVAQQKAEKANLHSIIRRIDGRMSDVRSQLRDAYNINKHVQQNADQLRQYGEQLNTAVQQTSASMDASTVDIKNICIHTTHVETPAGPSVSTVVRQAFEQNKATKSNTASNKRRATSKANYPME